MPEQINYEALANNILAQLASGATGSRRQAMELSGQGYSLRQKGVVSTTPTTTYGHGNGGLFSYPGMERPVFSAMILPELGLQSLMPVRPSNTMNPVYGIFTGVLASTGAEPTGVCDDPPSAGLSKLCEHSFVYGRMSRQSRVFDITRFGLQVNRADMLDLQLLGNALAVNPNPNVPTMPGAQDTTQLLNTEMAKALFELAISWARDFAQELYTGNPTNNTSGGGRKYFYGMDILINTGYKDAETGVLCPAADSIVRSFGGLRLDQNASSMVRTITYMMRNLRYISRKAGLDPATWVLVGRFGLFYELTEIWPQAYLTYRNVNTDNSNQNLYNDSRYLTEMRDQMREGMYLLIDGNRVPFVIDEAITETESPAGVFSSTLYFVPMTALGGTPVCYVEARNYDAPGQALDAARVFAPDGSYYTSDGGRFIWHRKPPANFCVQLMALTEPRVLLLTPHIAARLTSIKYSPLIHERESFTTSGYFVNGGKTDRLGYGPSLQTPN